MPSVIAAFVVVGVAAFLLSGSGGGRTTDAWQNVHPPVVPTQITPDGVPGGPAMPLPAR